MSLLHLPYARHIFLVLSGFAEIFCSPFIFEVLHSTELPIPMSDLHCLLEEFLPSYYYNDWYPDLTQLLNLSMIMNLRKRCVTYSPLKVFSESIRTIEGPSFSYYSSEVSTV